MYIKQVIIQGFKSYGHQTVLEPFDPGNNVVVGKNGSGKSNFFQALEFVLCDEFTNLQKSQREALLHEGCGPKANSAYVEIIFENSDRRLPVDKNEVSLRRTISPKNDQYILNKIITTRRDVMSLLESAGFSRSNPYYIVRQGKINQVTMTSESRLELLREVAGTKVYQQARDESLLILKNTQMELARIEDLLNKLENRMEDLEGETSELKEYEKLDKYSRCIQRIVYERKLSEEKNQLKKLLISHDKLQIEQDSFATTLEESQTKIKSVNRKRKKAQQDVEQFEEEQTILSNEKDELLRKKVELELVINDLDEEVKKNHENRNQIENQLEDLKKEIEGKETELLQIKPEYEELVHEEEKKLRELDLKKQELKELYSKQGRGAQFNTIEERNAWIAAELKKLNEQIEKKKKIKENFELDLENSNKIRVSLTKDIKRFEIEMNHLSNSINSSDKKSCHLANDKENHLVKRKDLCRREKSLQNQLESLKEESARQEHKLLSMFGKPLANGRNSVQKVIESFRNRPDKAEEVSNYHGLVIDRFCCQPEINRVVEVTAGKKLFYHIVESNEFATDLLNEINKQNLPGEITFMPLDRLSVPQISYPKSTPDQLPLITKLKFDHHHGKVMRMIFGRTLLCRDLETATKFAQQYEFDCMTLDGDKVASKGWLHGGYFDSKRSSMKTYNDGVIIFRDMKALENDILKIKEEISKVDNELTLCINEIQCIDAKANKDRDTFYKLRNDINMMKTELSRLNSVEIEKEKSLREHKSNLESMDAIKRSLETELQQDLTDELSDVDKQKIDDLNLFIKTLENELKEIVIKRQKLESEKNKIENTLYSFLNRKKDQLSQELQDLLMNKLQKKLKEAQLKLPVVNRRISEIESEIEKQKEKIKMALEMQTKASIEYDELKVQEKMVSLQLESHTKELGKLTNKLNILRENIQNNSSKLDALGLVPSNEVYSKLNKKDTETLFENLEKLNKKLKEYSNVNKKALEQFNVLKDQKTNLGERKRQLDKGYEKIQELMNVLQQKKHDAIIHTFKQVCKNFEDIFSKLVPQGKANLIMKKRNESNDSSSSETEGFDDYVGIDIKVSFDTKTLETKEMNHLSGGQKSLVALTMIFAIQKCDPAPFYLFDEIDQALDSEYRKAVAEMIHELSSKAQFIIVTFRPELLEHAKKFYGVRFYNKKSHVTCISREEAKSFVEST